MNETTVAVLVIAISVVAIAICRQSWAEEDEYEYLSQTDLFMANVDGTALRRITNDSLLESRASWSPDGKKLVFSATQRDNRSNIVVYDLETTERVDLLDGAGMDYEPVWSPDGKQIVFASNREEQLRLFRVNDDGSGLVCLTSEFLPESYHYAPTFSPDGTQLGFLVKEVDSDGYPATGNTLSIADSDGANPRQLYASKNALEHPVWSPGGEAILCGELADREPFLTECDVASGNTRRIQIPRQLIPDYEVFTPSYWPDKDGVIVVSLCEDAGQAINHLHTLTERKKLALLNIRGINSKAALFGPTFSPDGKAFVFVNGAGYSCHVPWRAVWARKDRERSQKFRARVADLLITIEGNLIVPSGKGPGAPHEHPLMLFRAGNELELRGMEKGDLVKVATIDSAGHIVQSMGKIGDFRLPNLPSKWPLTDSDRSLLVPERGKMLRIGPPVAQVRQADRDRCAHWLLLTIDGVFLTPTASLPRPDAYICMRKEGAEIVLEYIGAAWEGILARVTPDRAIHYDPQCPPAIAAATIPGFWPFVDEKEEIAFPPVGWEFLPDPNKSATIYVGDNGGIWLHHIR